MFSGVSLDFVNLHDKIQSTSGQHPARDLYPRLCKRRNWAKHASMYSLFALGSGYDKLLLVPALKSQQ